MYVHVYEMLSIAHEVLNFIRIFLSQVKLHHTARTFLQCPMQQITYFECRMKLLFSLAPWMFNLFVCFGQYRGLCTNTSHTRSMVPTASYLQLKCKQWNTHCIVFFARCTYVHSLYSTPLLSIRPLFTEAS